MRIHTVFHSETGRRHVAKGKACQDVSEAVRLDSGTDMAGVFDGAGSSSVARESAQLTCDTAKAFLAGSAVFASGSNNELKKSFWKRRSSRIFIPAMNTARSPLPA